MNFHGYKLTVLYLLQTDEYLKEVARKKRNQEESVSSILSDIKLWVVIAFFFLLGGGYNGGLYYSKIGSFYHNLSP